jgi:hypothetical protein
MTRICADKDEKENWQIRGFFLVAGGDHVRPFDVS